MGIIKIGNLEVSTPANPHFVGKSYNLLYRHIKEMNHETLRAGTLAVIEDPLFLQCPAAKFKHQAYVGGLVVHTAEVVDACVKMAKLSHLHANYDILVAAAVWHDYGKIYDYTVQVVPNGVPGTEGSVQLSLGHIIEYTQHRSRIRHLSRSYAMFMAEFAGKLPEDWLDQIGHCILSHHGRKEWGSPVEPDTTEAHILHYADALSAFCAKAEYEVAL